MSTGNRALVTFKQEIQELLIASEDLEADFYSHTWKVWGRGNFFLRQIKDLRKG